MSIEQEVDVMCNLSQGIKEAGIAEGRVEGRAKEIIETGYAGYTGTVTEEAEYFIAEGAGISVNVWEADGVE